MIPHKRRKGWRGYLRQYKHIDIDSDVLTARMRLAMKHTIWSGDKT